MLVRKATPERRARLAHEALRAIRELRARWALRELQAPLGPLDRLVLKVCRAFLDRWERRERRALLER